jgi:hypothetical protein
VWRRSCSRITRSLSSPSACRAWTAWPAMRRENRSGCRWLPSRLLSTSADSRSRTLGRAGSPATALEPEPRCPSPSPAATVGRCRRLSKVSGLARIVVDRAYVPPLLPGDGDAPAASRGTLCSPSEAGRDASSSTVHPRLARRSLTFRARRSMSGLLRTYTLSDGRRVPSCSKSERSRIV